MRERHFGIDLLRIISMYLVVTLHVLGYGGVLASLAPESVGFKAMWLLEIAAYCAVNCYALLSGYVSVNSRFKYSRIITLWAQVAFYTLLTTLAFKLWRPELLPRHAVIRVLLPVVTGQYWYFTAYFAMFFFVPYINRLLNTLDRRQFKLLVISIAALFSVLQTVFPGDVFKLSSGYSMFWLLALYIVGAYFRVTEDERRHGGGFYLAGFAVSVVIVWLYKFLPFKQYGGADLFVSYCSPFIFAAAVFLLLFCAGLKINAGAARGIIKFLAPASFGVYLIHTNPLIWEGVLRNRFVSFAAAGTPAMLMLVITAAAGIYLACSLADTVRIYLFKLLKISTLAERCESAVTAVLDKYVLKERTVKK